MEFAPLVELAKPVFGPFVEFYHQAFDEFDKCFPDSIRPSVERARAKVMHCRVLALLELKYGRTGSPRMVTDKYGLTYLLVERPDLRVGIRNKKFDRHGRSQNHDSAWQDEMRSTGLFPETQAYHTFIGCRLTTTLEPAILSISMTFEDKNGAPIFRHLIWTKDDGMSPPQENYALLLPPSPTELPPETKVAPKRRKKGKEADKDTDVG